MDKKLILIINPGSTSTKVAVHDLNNKPIFQQNIKHSTEDLKPFKKITDQYEFRKRSILEALTSAQIDINDICAVIGRGGLIKPIPSGIYKVNEQMKHDVQNSPIGEHASNLGCLIADDIAKSLGPDIEAFIADPVVVDEMEPIARIAGHPQFNRISIFHALNQKAVARRHAKTVNTTYDQLNLIIAHLGGGISVGAHQKGKVIDVNQALNGEGPFSPERSGTLPCGQLVDLCFSGQKTKEEIKKMLTGEGGCVAYLGTNDAMEIVKRIEQNDKHAKLIYEAMAYQVSKEIGACAAVLKGQVDAILLTGGIAYDQMFVQWIKERVEFIAPVYVYPGEDEMIALGENLVGYLKGEIILREYI